MLDILLNKGGAGVTMSRKETVERLDPIIEKHVRLNHAYNFAIEHFPNAAVSEKLREFQRRARMDVGKLNETVLSAGASPYNGTAIEPGDVRLPEGDKMLRELMRQEEDFLGVIDDELELDHHIRTKAILGNVRRNSEERLTYLRKLKQRL